jgi:hypothetical protein
MERVILSGCSGSSSCRTPVRHRSDPEPGSRLHALLGPSARADVKRTFHLMDGHWAACTIVHAGRQRGLSGW